MLENLGLLAGLGLLIVLALRGVNILVASLLCALVVAVTNDLSPAVALMDYYPSGPLGAFTFAGKFFLLFVTGAIFGKVMAESHAAAAIAYALARRLGPHRTLWIAMLATAFLTYGGVVVFIVIFTIYPLGLGLMQQADIPKRLFCAATALGAGTFTMTALPGTPSIHNVIAASALDTSLFAAGGMGIIAAVLMLTLGMAYLERERRKAAARGEGFVPHPRDTLPDPGASAADLPHWAKSSVPLLVVLGTIIVPRLLMFAVDVPSQGQPAGGAFRAVLAFADRNPVVWPSFALTLGTVLTVTMFRDLRGSPLAAVGRGAEESVMPLLNTAAVIGFGGVVTQTGGFEWFSEGIIEADLPPLLSIAASISVVSAIVGSASGGLQIFMETLAPQYLEMGVTPEVLHRIATLASGGLDSLPHCGAVIATFTIMGLTHREAYKDMGIITVVVPVISVLLVIAGLMILGVQ